MSITVHRRANSFETPPAWVREERRPSHHCIPASAQLPLPSFGSSQIAGAPRFAHPAEADFARLLTWYRVRWVYEPTVFAIDWASDGTPLHYFRPDFYLPDQRMYVELTTMRQPLVTRKNRKLRLVRDHYPSVRIKLLYRRDMERLRAAYAADLASAPRRHLGDLLADDAQIAGRSRLLAEQIADEWLGVGKADEPAPLVLATSAAAIRFGQMLRDELQRLGIVTEADQLHRTRFRLDAPSRQVRIARTHPVDLAGRRVLLVEDAISTGLSAAAGAAWSLRQHASEVRTCALLDRRPARLLDFSVDWAAFEAPDQPLAGFGLAMHSRFCDLPALFTVRDRD
jgi:hypoxanthine-guanine phosphoribosyltransferase